MISTRYPRDTQPFVRTESDADLRARLEYVTGRKLPAEQWFGPKLDALAEQYNLKRRTVCL